eukprot:TRINITY_DN15175_c0_g1_i1.p1 TRINITY_DN15175_c0_g1~~TRINITY_DN15175_c0_g1_i1.p1  ORF type:complete len:425 (+),score=124.30 TRINITY_DN15175_c0_g1_i1:43-1317(+)
MQARLVQCYLLLGVRMFQQLMRNVLAALLVYMPDEVAGMRGVLLSAVAAGYFFSQVPGGILADMLGAKNLISCAMFGSALCCMVIPHVYNAYDVTGMWWTLAVMGTIQGPLFPTSSVYLSRWAPPDERSSASTKMDIGISMGALISIPAGAYLGSAFGWQKAYFIVGCIAMCFVAVWLRYAADAPSKCWFMSKEEGAYLQQVLPKQRSKTAEAGETPLRLLVHPSVVAIFLSHMAFNYGAYFVTNWNPTYYKDVLGMSAVEAGLHLSMPHVTNLLGKLSCGGVSAVLTKRGFTRLGMRRFFTVASALGAGGALLPVYLLRDQPVVVTTLLVSTSNFFFGLAPSGFKANYLDITVKYTGVISGVGNTLGTCASYVGPLVVGHILATTGSWNLIFISIFSVGVVTCTFFAIFSSDRPVEGEDKPRD